MRNCMNYCLFFFCQAFPHIDMNDRLTVGRRSSFVQPKYIHVNTGLGIIKTSPSVKVTKIRCELLRNRIKERVTRFYLSLFICLCMKRLIIQPLCVSYVHLERPNRTKPCLRNAQRASNQRG